MSASPPPGIFSGVHELMINDGKFVQVANDYHVHGDMTTHVHNTSSIPSPPPAHHDTKPSRVDHKVDAVRVGGDQHIHGDYHVHYYPSRWSYAELPSNIRILTAMCRPNRPDHYHVYRGHEILFCSRFSPIYTRRNFPVFPALPVMERYARIIISEIDAGMYHVRLGNNTKPYRSKFWRYSFNSNNASSFDYMQTKKDIPKRLLKAYIPAFDYETFEKERQQLYMAPCMHGVERNPSYSAVSTPRAALFTHLDTSGVK